jgi:hypothetical protein
MGRVRERILTIDKQSSTVRVQALQSVRDAIAEALNPITPEEVKTL